jgi:hypothetical protein
MVDSYTHLQLGCIPHLFAKMILPDFVKAWIRFHNQGCFLPARLECQTVPSFCSESNSVF